MNQTNITQYKYSHYTNQLTNIHKETRKTIKPNKYIDTAAKGNTTAILNKNRNIQPTENEEATLPLQFKNLIEDSIVQEV